MTPLNHTAILQHALEQAGIGVWHWNLQTNAVHWSISVPALFGAAKDIQQLSYAEYVTWIDSRDRQHVLDSINQAIHARQPYYVEHRIHVEHGPPRWVAGSGVVMYNEAGQPSAMVGTVQEITARKDAEAALAASAMEQAQLRLERKLLEAQRFESIALLSAGVAHDVKNMLTVITGNLDLAFQDIATDHPAHESLLYILRAAQQANELTQQLMTAAGHGSPQRSQIDINGLVHELLPLLRASVPRAINLCLELEPDLPVLDGDIRQLRQVLLNLIINGAEAISAPDGAILIRTSFEHAPDGGNVALTVQDTGRGMDRSMQMRVFDPFFTTKTTGRGLGLAVVQGVVRAHDGTIALHSIPNHGTTITLRFPVAAQL